MIPRRLSDVDALGGRWHGVNSTPEEAVERARRIEIFIRRRDEGKPLCVVESPKNTKARERAEARKKPTTGERVAIRKKPVTFERAAGTKEPC